MTVTDWIALLGVLLGGGGGTVAVSKATRLVIAVENLVKELKQVRADVSGIVGAVQGHETRIARVEGQLQPKPKPLRQQPHLAACSHGR
jgi:hypothetical protein